MSNDSHRFWQWFETHEHALRGREESPLEELFTHLQDYSPGLSFEIGGAADGPLQLVFTAGGRAPLFPSVVALVAAAPRLTGWRFVALKPPQGFAFIHEGDGCRIDPSDCWFLPLHTADDPDALGIEVAVPGYRDAEPEQLAAAVSIVLDTGLGELAVANEIQHVRIGAIPASPEAEGYIELRALGRYLEWRRGKPVGA